jgi:O-antigen/teichoic acid export membrane protein
MTVTAENARPRLLQRLPLPDLSEPLLRNGLALSLSATLSSAIGFVFWLLAAHRYPPRVVGADAVAISALQLVGGVAQLNLANGMIRFLPGSGGHRRRFILGSYAVSTVVALGLGIGFVILAPSLASGLRAALSQHWVAIVWVVATACWGVFALEDGALTGLRHARWVPIENAGHGILKAALVVPLALISPEGGIFLAWGAATIVTIIVTNAFLFARAVPAEIRRAPEGILDLGQLRRYLPFDYLGSLCWLACTNLLPIFIIRRVGAAASAYFSLPWVVTYVLYLVSISLGSSLIVEATADPHDLRVRCRRVVGQLLRLLVPAVAVVVIAAPLILRLFGSAYASASVTTLRVLALSALPFILVSTTISALRVLQKTRFVFLINASFLVLVGAGTWYGLPRFGILAAAMSWLGAQILIAGVLLIVISLVGVGSARARLSAIARGCSLAGARLATIVHLPRPVRLATHSRNRRASAIADAVLSDFTRVAPSSARRVDRLDVISGGSDIVVLCPRDRSGAVLSILKVPSTSPAREDLLRQDAVLGALASDERLGDWRRLLPQYQLVAGQNVPLFAIESPMPGVNGLRLMRETPAAMALATQRALEIVDELHGRSARRIYLDTAAVRRFLDPLLLPLHDAHPTGRVPPGQRWAMERLDDRLSRLLEGRILDLSWIHADFTPANVLFGRDPVRVEGIVDWGQAIDTGLPALDAISWVCAVARAEQRIELGGLLRRLLAAPRWPTGGVLGAAAGALDRCGLPSRDVILLYWLSHIGSNLAKCDRRYVRNPMWWVGNVEPVLEALVTLP